MEIKEKIEKLELMLNYIDDIDGGYVIKEVLKDLRDIKDGTLTKVVPCTACWKKFRCKTAYYPEYCGLGDPDIPDPIIRANFTPMEKLEYEEQELQRGKMPEELWAKLIAEKERYYGTLIGKLMLLKHNIRYWWSVTRKEKPDGDTK